MTVILAPLWEVWNWSDSDVTFFAVVFLLFGAYGAGYAHAHGDVRSSPRWVYLALAALVIGFLMLAVQAGPCEPGECERPGP